VGAYVASERTCIGSGKRSQNEVLAFMVERLREYDAEVVETTPPELAATIATQLSASGRSTFVAPPALPAEWLLRGSIGRSTAVCPSPRLKRLRELSRPVSAALPIREPSFYTAPPVRDAALSGSPTPSGDFSTFPKAQNGDGPVGCAKSINGEAAGSACQFTLDRTAVLEIPSRSWKIVTVNITGNGFSDDSEG
jgi:hypothetical protein